MTHTPMRRRSFLGGTALSAFALMQANAPQALANPAGDASEEFIFEVTHSTAEWQEILNPQEFAVLRKKDTELPRSSVLWNNTVEGTYCCRGCQLSIYDSVWKVELDKGWAFFSQSRPNSVLMGIDGQPPDGMTAQVGPGAMIEAHCRRCGSHLGHILRVDKATLHCINGISLQFRPTTT